MTKLQPRRDIWQVRDADGLVHVAQVVRFFFEDQPSQVSAIQVSTGCHPIVTMEGNVQRKPWAGVQLPEVTLHRSVTKPNTPIAAEKHFTIVAWNTREETTCIQCAAAGRFE